MMNTYEKIRKSYGLSRVAMSKVLGFGVNQWRLYEEGAVEPKDSHALLIKLVMDPKSLRKLLLQNRDVLMLELGPGKFTRLNDRVGELLDGYQQNEDASYGQWVESLYK